MKKEEAIKILEECLKVEEDIIPLYSKHITNTLFFSGLEAGKADEVRKILDKLRTDSMKHRSMFQGLINKIQPSDRNVY